jgi:hypothetical protein
MPHHYGISGTSMGVAQKGTPSHHGVSQKTQVAPGKSAPISKKKTGGGSLVIQAIKAVGDKLEAASRPYNIKARKKYISKYNTNVPFSERINMSDEQIGSSEGLAALRDVGYKTNQDIINQGGNGGSVIKKVVGGQTLLAKGPTDAEVSQSDATNAAETKLTKRRVKARGRKMNIYTSSSGKTTDKLILGKKSLLGMV